MISLVVLSLFSNFVFAQSHPLVSHPIDLHQLRKEFIGIGEKTLPAAVSIYSWNKITKETGEYEYVRYEGAGFIIDPQGIILTAHHVVGEPIGGARVSLMDGRQFHSVVLAKDTLRDITILKIDANNLPYLEWGDSSKLQALEPVILVGNPYGLESSVSVGFISHLNRQVLTNDYSPYPLGLLQIDAMMNEGNSGGPLLNVSGEVVGMNIANLEEGKRIGFAIPINAIKATIHQWIAEGKLSPCCHLESPNR